MAAKIKGHRDHEVYQKAFDAAMVIHDLSLKFPPEERYSLTDQIRRASRAVGANMAEAWRKRRYQAAFVSKLNEVEGEAAETQVWIEFAVKTANAPRDVARKLYRTYDEILRTLVGMINHADKWIICQ